MSEQDDFEEAFGQQDIIMLHSGTIMRTHSPKACSGENCAVHNPSEHPLSSAPLNWRGDIKIMERICEHGVGHPDPDGIDHVWRTQGSIMASSLSYHGCDGCCVEDNRDRVLVDS